MLSVLMAALPTNPVSRVVVTPGITRCLQMWHDRIYNVNDTPVHYKEIVPSPPTTFGTHDACPKGLGGVFFGTDGTPFVWVWAVPAFLHEARHINILELVAHVVQMPIRTPLLPALMHALDGMDNTASLS